MGKKSRGIKRTHSEKQRQRRKVQAQNAPPHKIVHQYANPNALQVIGPFVPASWHVPLAHQEKLEKVNRLTPTPVAGAILVDTGATHICITIEAAQELGLKQVDIQETYGMHGKQRTPIFQARLCLKIQNQKVSTELFLERRVAGVADMEALFQKMGIRFGGNQSQRVIGLLGRDFLRHGTFKYYGTRGLMEIDLDLSTFGSPAPV